MENTTSQSEQPVSPHTDTPEPSRLPELTGLFFRLGFTAFGGPAAHIAMMRQEIVQRRKWLSDERFMDLIGIINLIPGPNSTQLAIYLGYIRAGWPGLLIAGIGFIAPAMLIVMALAWLYTTYGTLPAVGGLLYGIKAVVIAIVAYALWGLARSVLKSIPLILLAIAVLAIYSFFGIDTLLLLFSGSILYAIYRWVERWRARTGKPEDAGQKKGPILSLALPFLPGTTLGRVLFTMPVNEIATVAAPITMATLFLTFLKIGATLYGSGYVILAFLRNDFVEGLHWITEQQLVDAISIGQFTPGPVFTTATFIGYLVLGWQGALVASLAIFLPSFLFVPIIDPLARRLRSSPWTAPLLDGINATALALMAGVLIELGDQTLLKQDLVSNIIACVIALLSFGLLVRFKLNSTWLILAGGLIGLIKVLWF